MQRPPQTGLPYGQYWQTTPSPQGYEHVTDHGFGPDVGFPPYVFGGDPTGVGYNSAEHDFSHQSEVGITRS